MAVAAVSVVAAPRGAGSTVRLPRTLRHLLATRFAARRRFPPALLNDIESTTREAEAQHAGEIRFAVESALDLPHLWRGTTPRARALQVFSQLGVWDTAANNGVLVYVLLADKVVEIVADRGIAARVAQDEWDRICREMEQHYAAARFREGSLAGIRRIGGLLARHFPGAAAGPDALPDRPVLM
ncbi:MAG TPA: TPM domain-containing protein [Steroidobacteraceae bacterium]|nr:TPM domain-containing protein [Steroidobacteraceae bacterium]